MTRAEKSVLISFVLLSVICILSFALTKNPLYAILAMLVYWLLIAECISDVVILVLQKIKKLLKIDQV